ncbi:MBL fold metallo-hydrolase [Engelhardtia mirabilis]|uniref:Metallo-beta-lactamase superfamily protein n=1 Tax=Engelhardtia mirabilis TaxID=2528011 RepID=A0A518BFA2_9BACT|nr:Metallo-beta-lactamase superfamily protein [Planctomycetes bacterium Pla133]QDU99908.1 Metallo-beta-lactamase superfamily protein [Planctomycetes bacterium Pla86]
MKSTVLPDLYYSGVYQPDRRIDFNGFLWARSGGGVLIDPMSLDESQLAFAQGTGSIDWILLTGFDHLRAAPELAQRFGAQIAAPAGERGRFGEAADKVSHWFEGRDGLPGDLGQVIDVHLLHGGKSEVEAAFVLEPLRAVVFGDLVRSHESGRLRLLPEPKLSDGARALREVAQLPGPFDAVLLGDGDSLFRGAQAALEELTAAAR